MRRLYPLFVSFLATSALQVGCTDPPKPSKASEEDLAKIDKGEGAEGSTLGAIPSGPIAKVGDVEIPNEAFTSIYELKVKKYTDRGREIPTSADRRYRKSIAERLIYHEVLEQEAKALGVEHDAAALEERQAQQKRGIRDWEKHLERRGETEQSLTEMYIAELREKAILEKLGKLAVTEEEIDADYEKIKGNWKSDKPRVRASHILIPIGPVSDSPRKDADKAPDMSDEEKAKFESEAKAKAEEIHKLVTAADADFEAIAKEKSTGPSAAKGGDIGIFTADRMAEEFSDVAFKLDAGEISKPVKTKFGYHIIKVTGKWGPGELPKDALEDQIVNRLEQRKLHQGRRELKEELLAKYEIVDNVKPTLGPEPERKSHARVGGKKGPHRPMRDMSKVVDRKAGAAGMAAKRKNADGAAADEPAEKSKPADDGE
jgi:peptidyl-prolyl cis-trans isomerase C